MGSGGDQNRRVRDLTRVVVEKQRSGRSLGPRGVGPRQLEGTASDGQARVVKRTGD
jgi:ribosomal protein L1